MEITDAQYRLIEHCLPTQRGNVSLSNLRVLNAILYVTEQGCKWRGLPTRFGNWHTIYTRMNRWESIPFLVEIPKRPRCSHHAMRVPSTRSAFPILACRAARNCGRWR